MSDTNEVGLVDVFPYLQTLYERGGSDLFFSVGAPVHMKLEGVSQALHEPVLKPGEVQQLAYQLMSQKQIVEFERDLEMNLAVSVQNAGRFRVNVYYQRGEASMVIRLIKSSIPDFKSLGLPKLLEKLSMQDRGLILVVGAAGSGKSTTLAACWISATVTRAGTSFVSKTLSNFSIATSSRSSISARWAWIPTALPMPCATSCARHRM